MLRSSVERTSSNGTGTGNPSDDLGGGCTGGMMRARHGEYLVNQSPLVPRRCRYLP